MDQSSPEFVARLRDEVGDSLRSVVWYDADSYDLAYIRSDVAVQYSQSEMVEVVEDLRREGARKPRQEHLYSMGKLDCTVRRFDGGFVMHFPRDTDTGMAVAIDPTARPLSVLIEGCLHLIPERGAPG